MSVSAAFVQAAHFCILPPSALTCADVLPQCAHRRRDDLGLPERCGPLSPTRSASSSATVLRSSAAARSRPAASSWPKLSAQLSAVSPSVPTIAISAPASISTRTHSVLPRTAAHISGVTPYTLSVRSMLAPASSRSLRQSTRLKKKNKSMLFCVCVASVGRSSGQAPPASKTWHLRMTYTPAYK